MQLRFFTVVIILLGLIPARAQLAAFDISSGTGAKQSVMSSAKSKLQFVPYKKFKLYRLGVKVEAELNGYQVSDDSSTTLKTGSVAALFYLDSLKGSVALKNQAGAQRDISYEYKPTGSEYGVQNSKCKEYNLNLSAGKKPPAGVILAFHCEKVDNRIILSISTLGTAEINSSSLSEIDGKGETWRAFDLGILKAEAATVLELGLSKDGSEFDIKVLSKKIEDKKNAEAPENEKDKQSLRAGMIYSMNQVAIANSYSDSSPGIFVGFTSKPLFWGTKFEADFKQAFPSDAPIAISVSDLKLGLKRDFGITDSFFISPRGSFVNAKYSQQVSNLDVNLVSYGGGLGFSYYFSNRESLDLIYQMISIGSDVVSSASNIQLKINFYIFNSYNFIVGFETQNLVGKSSVGNAVKVDQNVILLGLGFN
ncbi:MAG: hypothetical protein K0R29_1921 [Pseudobdellovibrio sp.]|jgi:hypothetical protein|nr:hypothetical protein [Pseudobdellovibrio sp.]